MVIGAGGTEEIAALLFIDIALIVVVARAVGALFRRIGQPPVIGEIIAGILMGPTLLGAFDADLPQKVFPLEVRPFLSIVAQLGLVLFMFIVGLELDPELIKGKERVAAVISVSSIALPFGLGVALAFALRDSAGGTKFLGFALFIGAAMSITAFPVLARILTERGMYKTTTGALVLACAAVDDIMAWSILAVVTAIVQSSGAGELPRILGFSIAFVLVMFLAVKPILQRLATHYNRVGKLTPDALAVVLIGILGSSYVTSKIGIHSIFGAFLFGVIMPRRETAALFHALLDRIESLTVLLLLPVFFIATGLNVNVRKLGWSGVTDTILIVIVACAGKFIGATLAARAQKLPLRQSLAIGTLMNTRGLTELVILNTGLQIGVLSAELFTPMVLMAIITTVMTAPILRVITPPALVAAEVAASQRAATGAPGVYRVVVAIGNQGTARLLLDAAIDIVGDERPAQIVLTRYIPLPEAGEIRSGLEEERADQALSADSLRTLGEHARAAGVDTVVLSQLSGDFARDLAAAAANVDADLILLGWYGDNAVTVDRDVFVRAVLRDAPCDVVVLVDQAAHGLLPGPDKPIVVSAAGGFHMPGALELAVRTARSRGASTRLVDCAADDGGTEACSARLASLSRLVQGEGVDATPVLADGASREDRVVTEALSAGAVAIGVDDEWFRGGVFGAHADSLLARLDVPVLVVRAEGGRTRTGLRGTIEQLEGRGVATADDIESRLERAGPEPTHSRPATTGGGDH